MRIIASIVLACCLISCYKNPACKHKYDHTWKNWQPCQNETWMKRECTDCGWIEYKASHLGYR